MHLLQAFIHDGFPCLQAGLYDDEVIDPAARFYVAHFYLVIFTYQEYVVFILYFKDGFLEVTSEFVKARTRSIQLATLESVHVSRTLFLGTLALCGGMILFGILFADLLYLHEIALLVGVGAALLWLSWNFGTFTVYSKLTGAKGWAVTWWIKPLHSISLDISSQSPAFQQIDNIRPDAGVAKIVPLVKKTTESSEIMFCRAIERGSVIDKRCSRYILAPHCLKHVTKSLEVVKCVTR